MNGIELKDELDDIESRFMKWYNRSMYEEYFNIIHRYADNTHKAQLPAAKDTLFAVNEKDIEQILGLENMNCILDQFFETAYFSTLYIEKKQEMDHAFEERTRTINESFGFDIRYELALPGNILLANTELCEHGILFWNIDAFRFAANDYLLTAESRAANIWAFILTLLLVLLAIYCWANSRKK